MGTCDCCGRTDLLSNGTCCECSDKAIDIGISELIRRQDKDRFYKFIAEISEAIADMSCGCMGSNYTIENVKNIPSDSKYLTDIFDKYYKR